MNNNEIIKLLKNTGKKIELEVSPEKDKAIINMILRNNEEKNYLSLLKRILNPIFIRTSLVTAMIIFVIGIFFNIHNNKINSEKIYKSIISEIIEANKKKDINKALSLYSKEFYELHNKKLIKHNIQKLFKDFDKINYIPENKKLILKDNNMLIINKFTYIAYKNNKPVLKYKGNEKIYLKKENNKWKIIAWIYNK